MKVVCYYEGWGEEPVELMNRWRTSWEKNGFEPVVVGPTLAKQHPAYDEILEFAKNAPTVNGREFERVCWMRWLAFSQVAPAVFADYDVINYGLHPSMVPTLDLATHIGDMTVYAHRTFIENFIRSFKHATPIWMEDLGKFHLSDLCAFQQFYHGAQLGLSAFPNDPKSRVLPLVHFANHYVPKDQQHNYRWKFIDSFQRETPIQAHD